MAEWTRVDHPAAGQLLDADGSPIPWDTLLHESNRLETFLNDFALGIDDQVIELAKNGFAYDWMTEKIVCVFCRNSKALFFVREDEDIEEFHKRLSPRCPMVTGALCGNVTQFTVHLNTLFSNPTLPAIDYSIGNIPWRRLNEEANRIRTFAFHPVILIQNARQFTSNGFAYIPHEDSITCAFCGESLPNTIENLTDPVKFKVSDVFRIHQNLAPNCPMVTGERCLNIPAVLHLDPSASQANFMSAVRGQTNPNQPLLTSDRPGVARRYDMRRPPHLHSQEYGLNYVRPNYPMSRSQRVNSFTAIPNFDPTPLIEQGFFYHRGRSGPNGFPAGIKCYYCGYGFPVNYVAGHLDDLPIEHALHNAHCPALNHYVGEPLVKIVIELYRVYYLTPLPRVRPTVNDVRGQLAAQNITLQFNTQPPSTYPDNLSNPQELDAAVVVAMERGYSQAEAVQAAQTMINRGEHPRGEEIINIITGQNEPVPLDANYQGMAYAVETMRDSNLCNVCQVKHKDTLLMKCNHLCVCYDCSQSLRTCPICRQNITATIKIKRS